MLFEEKTLIKFKGMSAKADFVTFVEATLLSLKESLPRKSNGNNPF